MGLSTLFLTTALSMTAMQDGHGCQEHQHHPDEPCLCTTEAEFYRPGPPPLPVRVSAPGYRVIGRPIHVQGPVVHISAPPVYVDAPPVYVSPAQIFIERPDVHVRPSEVIVAPPEVIVEPCPSGGTCPVNGALESRPALAQPPVGYDVYDGERG